jgi:sterol desaturase/sphingolipid hydroxylase (fatty acid hydroxylase superfamily)
MTAPDPTTEIALRLGAFLGLFAVFALWEALAPALLRRLPRGRRWGTNLVLVAIDTAALRLLAVALPLLAVGAAVDAQAQGWGLFNALGWPGALEGVLAVLLFDLCIWAQHLVTHKVPLFWRFHRVHHADREMDVTTAVRFHPVEILASMGVKIGLVYALGPSPWAVLAFEVLLSGTALFSHANLALPERVERALRLVIVTPAMHLVHHSDRREEHDANYGFCLSVWDRLFGTMRAGRQGQTGLGWAEGPERLGWSLWLPFR